MKNKIIELIADNDLKNAFRQIEDLLNGFENERYKWVQLKSQWNSIEEEKAKGIIEGPEYKFKLRQVRDEMVENLRRLNGILSDQYLENDDYNLSVDGFEKRLQESVIDRYELLEPVDKGPAIIFFKARQRFDDRYVTIKALTSQNLTQDSHAFEEINSIKYLKHRNIRTVLDDSNSKEYPKYVILEYIDGFDLETIIEQTGPRTIIETKNILVKICDALYYLHKRKNFHTDLRPSRIMIDEEGEPILTLITEFRSRNESNYLEILSEFQYMSPERLRSEDGELEGDSRSNQFSLGILAHYLITGNQLFSGKSLISFVEQRQKFHNDEIYRALKLSKLKGPDEFTAIIKRLMSPDKEDRFSSIKKVLDALNAITIFSKDYYEIARESYQRCTAYTPKFTSNFFDQLLPRLPKAEKIIHEGPIDRKSLELMLHSSINLMIETHTDDSYMNKIKEVADRQNLTKEDYIVFFEVFLEQVAQCDYLWSEEIENAWKLTLDEALDDLTSNV